MSNYALNVGYVWYLNYVCVWLNYALPCLLNTFVHNFGIPQKLCLNTLSKQDKA
jgi:hypothetical protein